MVTDGFNSLQGVTCNFTEGAMYSFPQVLAYPSDLPVGLSGWYCVPHCVNFP